MLHLNTGESIAARVAVPDKNPTYEEESTKAYPAYSPSYLQATRNELNDSPNLKDANSGIMLLGQESLTKAPSYFN